MPERKYSLVRTPGQKRLLVKWGAALAGIAIGALAGDLIFAHAINNPAADTVLGAVIFGGIGFEIPTVLRMFHHPHKAQ